MTSRVAGAARRAMDKAVALRKQAVALCDVGTGYWTVRSASSQAVYTVFPYSYNPPGPQPWWVTLGCTCPAAEANMACCWHKALVHLLRNEGELDPAV